MVPWTAIAELIRSHASAGTRGRQPFPIETLLCINSLQQSFCLDDPAMEEALFDVQAYREFAGLDVGQLRLPDESTILRFRRLLEEKKLAA